MAGDGRSRNVESRRDLSRRQLAFPQVLEDLPARRVHERAKDQGTHATHFSSLAKYAQVEQRRTWRGRGWHERGQRDCALGKLTDGAVASGETVDKHKAALWRSPDQR